MLVSFQTDYRNEINVQSDETNLYNASYVEHGASYSRKILMTNFRSVTSNEVSLSFKINGNFRHNYITIYIFTAV